MEIMKHLKQFTLAIAFVAALTVSASAQKDGDKKPPPKEKPPVIVPKEKPKEDRPKEDKKPQMMIVYQKYKTD